MKRALERSVDLLKWLTNSTITQELVVIVDGSRNRLMRFINL